MKKGAILSVLKIITLFFMITFFYYGFIKKSIPPPFSWINEHAKNAQKELEYKGIIIGTYRIFNHDTPVFLVRTEEKEEFEVNANNWMASWKNASIGDSIIKSKNELRIIIKKPDGSSQSFDYWE